MNPYLLLAVMLGWAASVGGAFFYGQGVGADAITAKQAAVDQAIQDTRAAAQQSAAEAIAKLAPVNKTIVQKVQREIQTERVYSDCRVPPAGVQLANEAITGRPSAEPASSVVVPRGNTP